MSNSKIQSEILKVIRGKLTSSAFSQKLGYRFNQYARWEKGERRLLWADFVSICRIKHLPIREQMKLYLGVDSELDGDPDMKTMTKALLNGLSIDEAAKASKISRSKISRWLNGKAVPTFSDVYSLLRLGVNVLSFFEPLVDLEKVPSLATEYNRFHRQREVTFAFPYLDALLEALVVRRYENLPRHDSQVLSTIAGLPIEVVDRSLTALFETGLLEKKSGKYKIVETGVDYRSDKVRMAKILAHWLKETTDVVEKSHSGSIPGSLLGFSVLSLSNKGHEKASQLLREFVRAIHVVGSEDAGPKEKVFVFTVSLVDAERFGSQ